MSLKEKNVLSQPTNDFAEITYLRALKGITFNDLAKKVGISAFWLRKQIKDGNEKYIEMSKEILKN